MILHHRSLAIDPHLPEKVRLEQSRIRYLLLGTMHRRSWRLAIRVEPEYCLSRENMEEKNSGVNKKAKDRYGPDRCQ